MSATIELKSGKLNNFKKHVTLKNKMDSFFMFCLGCMPFLAKYNGQASRAYAKLSTPPETTIAPFNALSHQKGASHVPRSSNRGPIGVQHIWAYRTCYITSTPTRYHSYQRMASCKRFTTASQKSEIATLNKLPWEKSWFSDANSFSCV